MGFRTWNFGQQTAEAAAFDGESWGARSPLVWGSSLPNQEDTETEYNSAYLQVCRGDGADDFVNQAVIEITLDQIKAKLGQIPILLQVLFNLRCYSSLSTGPGPVFDIYRMFVGWDNGDTTNRYSDASALITWTFDAYSPYPGYDRATNYYSRYNAAGGTTGGDWIPLEITGIVERALRDNVNIRMLLTGYTQTSSSSQQFTWKPTLESQRPYLSFVYMFPIEFYESNGANAPDYSSVIEETEDGNYYLGPVERGATGSAVQGWIRNLTTATQQVELFDDHPEWTTPVQRVGSGSTLDYITLASNATSQLYTVVFYSTTQFEVKAEAYRDNAVSYHPQINADGSWRGTVSSTFTSPSGGLTIPAAAWQASNISTGDEFEIGVRGDTTDTGWPADSNTQVEISGDNAGVSDGKWRPVKGHRERSTAAVTINAASVFIPLRHMEPSVWTVGETCFIHNADDYDEGVLSSVQERDLETTPTFTGSGLNDATFSGNYNGTSNKSFRVQIDATGTPDTFSWSNDGTTSWEATGVSITGSPQLLEDGVYVDFGATTGHTSADYWVSDAECWGLTIGSLSVTSNSYNPGAYVAQTLAIRDLDPTDWSVTDALSGASQSPASRIYVADTTPFTQGDAIFIQNIDSDGDSETATIASGGVDAVNGYLDLTANLTNDYEVGSFVAVNGTGERAFWMRPVANSTTVEELKTLRFNARIL
jgi:hypothetical protein